MWRLLAWAALLTGCLCVLCPGRSRRWALAYVLFNMALVFYFISR